MPTYHPPNDCTCPTCGREHTRKVVSVCPECNGSMTKGSITCRRCVGTQMPGYKRFHDRGLNILAMRCEGTTFRAIGEKVDLSTERVRQIFRVEVERERRRIANGTSDDTSGN